MNNTTSSPSSAPSPSPSPPPSPPSPTSSPSRPYIRIKLLSLGPSSSGKSCLIKRYCEKKFVNKYISTIGIDFGVRAIKCTNNYNNNAHLPLEMRVNFWDLSGDPVYSAIATEFHCDATTLLLCFDRGEEGSKVSDTLDSWLMANKANGGRPVVTAVVACKCDHLMEPKTAGQEEGKKYAEKRGFLYFETSAKEGTGVNEMFQSILNNTHRELSKIAINSGVNLE